MIRIEQPDEDQLATQGVAQWPIWEHGKGEFPWHYDETETCYILEGEVSVTPESGEAVVIRRGDLVTFPAGMSCRWHITEAIRKHYRFG